MTSEIFFTVDGEPQGKARHRTTKTGHTYTPAKTVQYERLVQWAYHQAHKGFQFQKGATLGVLIQAYYGIPKSATKKKRAQMISGEIRPTKKPDWDNVGKVICDSLNGIAYHDDAQVVVGTVEKWYAEQPRVEVRIFLIKGE